MAENCPRPVKFQYPRDEFPADAARATGSPPSTCCVVSSSSSWRSITRATSSARAMSIDPMNDPERGPAAGANALDHALLRTGVRAPLAAPAPDSWRRARVRQNSRKFLLTRGLWLIFVEIFIISTADHASAPGGIEQLGGKTLAFMQVISAIGASMVLLAALQFLGRKVCLALGAAHCSRPQRARRPSGP